MRLVGFVVTIWVLLAGAAHADTATRELGTSAVTAARDDRCAAALRMLATIDESDHRYRDELARDPAVQACLDADRAAALARRPEKNLVNAESLTIAGSLVGPLLVPLGLYLGAVTRSDEMIYLGVGAGAVGAALLASSGGWYAHGPWLVGLGLHVVGIAAATWGATVAFGCLINEGDEYDSPCSGSTVERAFYGGLLAYAAGSVWDLATEGRAVRAWNQSRLQVAPTFHHGAPGLVLSGRF
jgi:hypothetical protein